MQLLPLLSQWLAIFRNSFRLVSCAWIIITGWHIVVGVVTVISFIFNMNNKWRYERRGDGCSLPFLSLPLPPPSPYTPLPDNGLTDIGHSGLWLFEKSRKSTVESRTNSFYIENVLYLAFFFCCFHRSKVVVSVSCLLFFFPQTWREL